MNLRCKPGDLAVILHDIPECVENIGRMVIVRGPVLYNYRYKHQCWLIKPVHPAPWWVDRYDEIRLECVTWHSRIEHPDAWMLPIRPQELDRFSEDVSLDIDQFLARLLAKPYVRLTECEEA